MSKRIQISMSDKIQAMYETLLREPDFDGASDFFNKLVTAEWHRRGKPDEAELREQAPPYTGKPDDPNSSPASVDKPGKNFVEKVKQIVSPGEKTSYPPKRRTPRTPK